MNRVPHAAHLNMLKVRISVSTKRREAHDIEGNRLTKTAVQAGNPNNIPVGTAVHGVWDILVGHLSQLFDRNIDPANCPW
jgi:hypothetical protein